MNTRTILVSLGAATLLAIVSADVLFQSNPQIRAALGGPRQFEGTGKIIKVDASTKTVQIAHQAIPGFMPAMAMPFPVRKASLLNGLTAGDPVRFKLVVTETDSWLDRIDKLQSGPEEAAPSNAPETAASANPDADRVQTGETVPDFALIDQDGRPLHLGQFRGQAVLVTFVYTRCPLPNFCPLMSRKFAELQERLGNHFDGRFHLLSITMDPEFDQPPILKSYAIRYSADPKDWTFGTGPSDQINLVASLFGLTHQAENGLIAHNLRTALIGPDGKLLQVWNSNVWTPYEVERSVAEALSAKSQT
jgi:protein SCO1/2